MPGAHERRVAERTRSARLIRDSIGLLSSKWSVDILLALGDGTRRYHELLEDLQPISEKVLTQTLRGMERDGLVARRVHAEVPPRVEYALTPLGATMAPPLKALGSWSLAHGKRVEEARDRFDVRLAAKRAPPSGTGRLRRPDERGGPRAVLGRDVTLEPADAHRGLARVLAANEVGGGRASSAIGDHGGGQLAAVGVGRARASPRRREPRAADRHLAWPCRHGRPNESVIDDRAAERGAAARGLRRRGPRAAAPACRARPALDASTPALAHTKPCRVRQMMRPRSARRTSSRLVEHHLHVTRVLAVLLGELERLASRARPRPARTTRPSALETTLWATASTSVGPQAAVEPARRLAEERGQVVARPDLRHARERGERDHAAATRRSSTARVRAAACRPRVERRAQRGEVVGRVDVEPERRQVADLHRRARRARAGAAWRANEPAPNDGATAPGGVSSSAFVPLP